MKNTFGNSISLTVFGESHGECVGAVIDGLAAGIVVDENLIREDLKRRAPATSTDTARREKAMKVLNVMLSEEAQNRIVADGQDVLSYSQNVSLRLTEYMKDIRPVVEENHMYIRIASNDFFSISKDVVSRMIAGELTAKQAYQNFNAQLLTEKTTTDETVLTSGKSYSNVFHKNGGSASFSVMANTLRGVYGTDVLIAAANSFTGSVLQADYNQKMAASMIMPNGLMSRQRTMTGAELKLSLIHI